MNGCPTPPFWGFDLRTEATTVTLTVSGVFFLLFMAIRTLPVARWSAITGMVFTTLIATGIIARIWDWASDPVSDSLFGLLMVGIPTCFLLLDFEKPRGRVLRLIGLVFAALSLLAYLWSVWSHPYEPITVLWHAPLAAAIALAYINVMSLWRQPSTVGKWIRRSVTATVIAAAALVIIISPLWGFFPAHSDFPEWHAAYDEVGSAIAVCAFLAAGGTVALTLLATTAHLKHLPRPCTDFPAMAITCPRCRHARTAPIGPSACPECQLRFNLALEEPACSACGYLLYMCKSDHCPECGASVPTPASPPPPAVTTTS